MSVNQLARMPARSRTAFRPSMMTPTPMSHVPSGTSFTKASPPSMIRKRPQLTVSRRLFSSCLRASPGIDIDEILPGVGRQRQG
jgi:hypothetical protein